MRVMISAALLLTLSASAANAASLPKPIRSEHDGTRYPPLCSDKEIKKLKDAIFKLPPSQKPQEAFDLAKAMLCGDTPKEEALVLGRMANPIVQKSEQTGIIGVETISLEPSASLLVRGQAWSRGESVRSERDGEINVSYASNEACMASFLLKLKDGQWKIAELESGCD